MVSKGWEDSTYAAPATPPDISTVVESNESRDLPKCKSKLAFVTSYAAKNATLPIDSLCKIDNR